MLRRKAFSPVLRLAMIIVMLAAVLAIAVPAGAQTASIDQIRYPAPPAFVLNTGTEVESFWWKINHDSTPVFMTHEIYYQGTGVVIHRHAWTFAGSNIAAGGNWVQNNPIAGSVTIGTATTNGSAIFNPENTVGDAEHGNITNRNLYAHNVVVPAGVPPGIYTSRVTYYSAELSGNPTDPAALVGFDSRSEVTFLVGMGIILQKYHDLNGNGQMDNGEPGIDDWHFSIVGPPNAFGTGINTFSGNTSNGGFLAFTALNSGNYTITETMQPNWVATDPPGGTQKIVDIPAGLPQDGIIRFGNLLLQPDTSVSVGVSSAGQVPTTGGPVTLTFSEDNTGNLPLNNVSVQVTSDLAAPWNAFTLTKAGPNPAGTVFAGDTDNDSILDVNETWTWTIANVPIPGNPGPGVATHTFVAIGHGLTDAGTDVTFPEFQGERGSASVSVPPPITVPGVSPLGLGLLIAALGGLMGLFLLRRSRQSKA